MHPIEIYTKSWCPYCALAKDLLERRALAYHEVDVTEDLVREAQMHRRSGRTSVPQIFVNGKHLGGYDDLAALDATGGLWTLTHSEEENNEHA